MKEFSTGRLLHTPEGVRDIYGAEYAKKRTVTDCIRKNMLLYGYEEIQTPVFESFDVFSLRRLQPAALQNITGTGQIRSVSAMRAVPSSIPRIFRGS